MKNDEPGFPHIRLAGGPDDARVDAFFDRVRSLCEEPPAPQTISRHMAAVMEAVRAQQPVPEVAVPVNRTRRRLHVVFAFAAAFLSIGIVVAGLSYAGVITLPSPVRGVFHFMHLDQPAQSGDVRPAGPLERQQVTPSPGATTSASPHGTTATAGSNNTGPAAAGNVPGHHGGDSPGGSGGGDSPSHPGGDSCQLTGADIQNCLP